MGFNPGAALAGGVGAGFLFGGGDEEDKPTPWETYQANNPRKRYGTWSDQELLDAYDKSSGTASLLKTLGRDWKNSALKRIQGILDKRGIAPGGVDGAGDTTTVDERARIIADMEAEIAAAIARAFKRLDALSGASNASPSRVARQRPRRD